MKTDSIYEDYARLQKATRLANMARAHGLCAVEVEGMDEAQWSTLTAAANQQAANDAARCNQPRPQRMRAPSDETRALVIEQMRNSEERARAPKVSPFPR